MVVLFRVKVFEFNDDNTVVLFNIVNPDTFNVDNMAVSFNNHWK